MYNHRRQTTTSTTSPAATATPSVLGFFKSPPAAAAASAAGSWAPALAKTLSMDSRSGQGELRTKAIDAEAAFLSANKPSLKRPLETNSQALPQKRVLPPGFGSTPSYPTTSSYSSSSYKSHSSAYKAASSSKSGKTEFRFDDPVSKALSTSSLRATAATKPLGKRSTPTDPSTTSNSSSTAPFKINSEPGITLTNEQSRVLDLVANGENLFYTGSAGTGKSVLMRQIINGLRTRMTRDQIAITAPTGIAATNIGGVTLHSFAGCGLAIEPVKDLVKKIQANRKSMQRWKAVKVLIIDEISMVEGQFFDKLNQIAKHVRNDPRPFGGIQLIVCGDFMQLPPVNKREVKFAFEADGWKECMTKTIMLKEVFRQKDAEFIKILNEIRMGEVSLQTEETLKKLSRPLSNLGGLVPTELFALRNEVDACNKRHLAELRGQSHFFKARRGGTDDNRLYERLDKECNATELLELKVGAQVMMIKNNIDMNLVNGSMGIVVGFEEDSLPVVDFRVSPNSDATVRRTVSYEQWKLDVGNISVTKDQIPLVLAYALSIHKSQGQTLPLLRIDLGKVFEKGQSYVALSRAVKLDGLQVLNFKKEKVLAHPKVVAFNKALSSF